MRTIVNNEGKMLRAVACISMCLTLMMASAGAPASVPEGLTSGDLDYGSSKEIWQLVSNLLKPQSQQLAPPARKRPLQSFCGLSIGPKYTAESTVVDCSCCATQYVGDPEAQVDLLYGSNFSLTWAVTKDDHGKFQSYGYVPIWSLGSHTPWIWCDRDKPRCLCQDETWKIDTKACVPGDECRHNATPTEWPSVCAEAAACPGRDEALGRKGASLLQIEGDAISSCSRPEDHGGRFSLGQGLCEDMRADQCNMFFRKEDQTGKKEKWRLCKVETATKTCHAQTMSLQEARKRQDELEAWAAQEAYSPELLDIWDTELKDDGTVKVTSRPPFDQLRPFLDNLSPRWSFAHIPKTPEEVNSTT